MSWAAIVVGVGTTVYGAVKQGQANKKAKAALGQRKAYQTPTEVFQILNALENRSQGDTQTRDFQTQELDNAFADQLGLAELLGADPNDLSALFNQKMRGIIQVGQQFHASNMEAFGKYIGGLDMVAQNKTAEWRTQQDLVKDKQQAAASDMQAVNATINSGLNTTLAGVSSLASNNLYGGNSFGDNANSGAKGVERTSVTYSDGRKLTWNPVTLKYE